MALKDEVEQLRRVPLFSNLEPQKLKLLAFSSGRLSFDAGQVLFRQGDFGDAAYVVLSGTAEVLVDSPSGPVRVASVDPNAIIGEVAILCNVARTATIRATSPLEVLRIRKDDFLRLLSEFPQMTVEIMRVLASRLSDTTTELTEARAKLAAVKREAAH
jgi:CRP-like cAMP-binding protein